MGAARLPKLCLGVHAASSLRHDVDHVVGRRLGVRQYGLLPWPRLLRERDGLGVPGHVLVRPGPPFGFALH